MRKTLVAMAAVVLFVLNIQAQRIEVVDSDGNGIHLVSVLTEDGNMIGTTSLGGVIADVKGASRVLLTHVAYKPMVVDVASLQNGKVTMEDIDYSLAEVVVKPKSLIYVETYYRVYAYANDSLRYYAAGILPNAFDPKKKKVKTGSRSNCYGDFAANINISTTWAVRADNLHVGRIYSSGANHLKPGGEAVSKYFLTIADEGNGRLRVSNPEGTVGYIATDKDQVRTTLDGAKMQMYRNKALGQDRMLKLREKKEYNYQFSDIFDVNDEGSSEMSDLVMYVNHWEWNGSKGRMKFVIETYATEHGYMDDKEFKAKKNELKRTYRTPMSLNDLEAYATAHGIPALLPSFRKSIEGLKKGKR